MKSRPAEAGFTLVELIVVIVIIGLISSAALLAIPSPGGSLASEAERFAARTRAAQERAIADNRPLALHFTKSGYLFQGRLKGKWHPLPDKPLSEVHWNEGTTASTGPETGPIILDGTGYADPLALTLTRDGETVAVEIAGGGTIRVHR